MIAPKTFEIECIGQVISTFDYNDQTKIEIENKECYSVTKI